MINEETNKEEDFLTPAARDIYSLDEYVIGETNERMSLTLSRGSNLSKVPIDVRQDVPRRDKAVHSEGTLYECNRRYETK